MDNIEQEDSAIQPLGYTEVTPSVDPYVNNHTCSAISPGIGSGVSPANTTGRRPSTDDGAAHRLNGAESPAVEPEMVDLDRLAADLADHHPPHSVAVTMRLARRSPTHAERIARELAAHRARLGFGPMVTYAACPCELGDCADCDRDAEEREHATEPTAQGSVYDLLDGEVF